MFRWLPNIRGGFIDISLIFACAMELLPPSTYD
jgi:hypothetical protein